MPALVPLRRVSRGLVLSLALGAAACTTGGALPGRGLAAGQPVETAAPPSFAPLVRRVLPAVVNIAVTQTVSGADMLAQLPPDLRDTPLGRAFRRRFGDRSEQVNGAGSGFIIDPSGLIVTNNHVIAHASTILVSLADGTRLPARVLGADPFTDVALLKVDPPHPLPAIAWGDSRNVRVGDWIIAAGNPFGLGGSVSAGIVSAEGRSLGAGPLDRFLQLDAPINPGNSGGPAFDMAGQVVGMTTAIVSPSGGSVGIGFAIPSDLVRRTVAALRAHGHIDRGWLGVAIETLHDDDGRRVGVRITGVERGGPAAAAGLQPGDQVLAVNGGAVDSARALIRAVAAVPPGRTVRVELRRQGQVLNAAVIAGRRPAEPGN